MDDSNNNTPVTEAAKLTTDYSDTRYEVLPSYRFMLRVELFFDVDLKSIRPFQKENEFEYIEEGGLNDYVHIKRKHASKPHTLVVERYINENFYDPMPQGGASFLLPLLLFVGGNHSLDVTENVLRTYVFFGATVMTREVSGFDSEKSGLLTETITIAYNQIYVMDTPGDTTKTAWDFTQGIKNKYANQGWLNLTANQKLKSEFEADALANLWEFGDSAEDYLGNGVRVAEANEKLVPQNKVTKEKFENQAKNNEWHFGNNAQDYEGKGKHTFSDMEAKISQNQKTVDEFQRAAETNTWHFGRDELDYNGSGPRVAEKSVDKIPQNTKKKTEFEAYAEEQVWKFSDGTKGKSDSEALASKAEADTWRFGTNPKQYKGNSKFHGDRNDVSIEIPKADLESRNTPWPKASYARKNGNETPKATLEARAKPWPGGEYRMKMPTTGGESKEDFLKS
ncbi:MAG: hypothetical protein K5853_09480 [Lachnospiraceae bacterium]|nr:hypothetical protein [Lachnospiraceae bacterium]